MERAERAEALRRAVHLLQKESDEGEGHLPGLSVRPALHPPGEGARGGAPAGSRTSHAKEAAPQPRRPPARGCARGRPRASRLGPRAASEVARLRGEARRLRHGLIEHGLRLQERRLARLREEVTARRPPPERLLAQPGRRGGREARQLDPRALHRRRRAGDALGEHGVELTARQGEPSNRQLLRHQLQGQAVATGVGDVHPGHELRSACALELVAVGEVRVQQARQGAVELLQLVGPAARAGAGGCVLHASGRRASRARGDGGGVPARAVAGRRALARARRLGAYPAVAEAQELRVEHLRTAEEPLGVGQLAKRLTGRGAVVDLEGEEHARERLHLGLHPGQLAQQGAESEAPQQRERGLRRARPEHHGPAGRPESLGQSSSPRAGRQRPLAAQRLPVLTAPAGPFAEAPVAEALAWARAARFPGTLTSPLAPEAGSGAGCHSFQMP